MLSEDERKCYWEATKEERQNIVCPDCEESQGIVDWSKCTMCGKKLTGAAEDCPCFYPNPIEELRTEIYALSADSELISILNKILELIEEK